MGAAHRVDRRRHRGRRPAGLRGAAGDVLAEIGRQTVAAIPDADPEWEERYHEAMAQARSRVAALESEAD